METESEVSEHSEELDSFALVAQPSRVDEGASQDSLNEARIASAKLKRKEAIRKDVPSYNGSISSYLKLDRFLASIEQAAESHGWTWDLL